MKSSMKKWVLNRLRIIYFLNLASLFCIFLFAYICLLQESYPPQNFLEVLIHVGFFALLFAFFNAAFPDTAFPRY